MWRGIGWIFVGLALIGIVIPIMPTVPFLLVAAYCFQRGSPQLHRWLREHPRLGPSLRDWEEYRVIRLQTKLVALLGVSISVGYVVFFREVHPWVKIALVAVCASAMTFVFVQKSRR